MRISESTRTTVVSLVAALALACSDSTAPAPERPEASLSILKIAPTTPPLLSTSVTVNACSGQETEARLFFDNGSGMEGEDFARLKIDAASLLTRPDGTAFAPGDCVSITMTAPDPASKQVLVQLEPTGLKFDPAHPAELRMNYGEAEGLDNVVLAKVGVWRQEKLGDPFVLIGSAKLTDVLQVSADLTGFSRYALAY
jgi:hypothetical protein